MWGGWEGELALGHGRNLQVIGRACPEATYATGHRCGFHETDLDVGYRRVWKREGGKRITFGFGDPIP